METKLFNLSINGEFETVEAESILHAILFYSKTTGIEIDDIDHDDDIEEIPENLWDSIMIRNIDGDCGEKEFYTLRELKSNKRGILSSTA